jgi:hypothetical protein
MKFLLTLWKSCANLKLVFFDNYIKFYFHLSHKFVCNVPIEGITFKSISIEINNHNSVVYLCANIVFSTNNRTFIKQTYLNSRLECSNQFFIKYLGI